MGKVGEKLVCSNKKVFLLAFSSNSSLPSDSASCIMFLFLKHLRPLLLLVVTVAFASPLLPDADFLGQASIGSAQEKVPASDSDVNHGPADGTLSENDYLDSSAVNPASIRIAQAEDEITEDQFQEFQKTECGGENSVCCMGDRTYFSSGVGMAWPCSMSIENVSPTLSKPYLLINPFFV